MANSTFSSSFLLLLALLLVWCPWGEVLEEVNAAAATGGGELWCVAKNNAEDAALQSALDWACGPGGADCSPIQQGGVCSDPPDIQSYASYAFNYYFHRNGLSGNGLSDTACDFSGTATLTILNPSHGNCIFPSSTSSKNGNFSGSATPDMGAAIADASGVTPISLPTWGLSSTVVFAVMLALATTSSIFAAI